MWDSLTRTLLALTFVTGILDAVSFLALGNVFVAMQTGNVVFLGLGISGTAGTALLPPLVALGAFVAGGLAATLLARPNEPGDAGLRFALAVEVALLSCAALLAAIIEVEPKQASAYVLVALLSLSMGLRNTIARRVGDPNIATTVLNLTLTAFTAHTPTGFASQAELGVRIAAIAAILAGAVAGALLLKASLALAIAAAAVVVLAVALGSRLNRWRTPPRLAS